MGRGSISTMSIRGERFQRLLSAVPDLVIRTAVAMLDRRLGNPSSRPRVNDWGFGLGKWTACSISLNVRFWRNIHAE